MKDHANSNEHQRTTNSVGSLNSRNDSFEAIITHRRSLFLTDRLLVFQRAHMSKLLLSACNVQELGVRSLKHRHTKRNEDAHHPKDYSARKVCAKRVSEYADGSIDMEDAYSSK